MKKISIADMTLSKCSSTLSFKEKIEIARHLDNLNADVIDMPEIENKKTDTLLIRTVAAFVKNSVISVCTGMSVQGVTDAAAALSSAKKARLKVALPVSSVQMEYTCHKKAPKMLLLAKELFAAAKSKCEDVEFFAVDATRAEEKFLSDMINAAAEAGVTTVTLCDNEAAMMPDEFAAFVAEIKQKNPVLETLNFGVLCENRSGMATASAIMAVKSGVTEVKCCVGSDIIPNIDTFAGIIKNYGDRCNISSGIKYTQLHRITRQIEWIVGASDKNSITSESAIAETVQTPLDKNDDIDSVSSAVKKLGYDLSDDDYKKVYDEFKRVAAKKAVGAKELDAIVASTALQVPPTYKIISYVINNGNIISSSAQIKLQKGDTEQSGISIGDGPIDASFRAVEQIIGHHYELDDFQIQAVTEGREAVGQAIVRLRSNGRLYSGNGISTDIIGASIRAYISAVNKIVYEEAN